MADRVGPLGLIQSYIGQGISATEGLRQYREAGGQIRDQRWYRAWGEMSAEIATRDSVMAAPLNRAPRPEERVQVQSNKPGGYLYRGGVVAFDIESGDIQLKAGSVRSQTLMTYAQAQEAIFDQLANNAAQYGLSVIGSFITAVRELVPIVAEPGLEGIA